jgi:hypothetical protein
MKYLKNFLIILLAVFFTGCEKVISVDLDTAPPKLVVDASINWLHGTSGNEQKIKLSTTTGYFSAMVPSVSGATITVTNSLGTVFNFIENEIPGTYVCNNFEPQIDENYTLTINYNGQILQASEMLKSVVPIDRIEQITMPGVVAEEDRIDIRTYFTDPGNTDNFYLTRTQTSINAVPEYEAAADEFFQGNQIYDLYMNENLKPGNILEVQLSGISERYFIYMSKLISFGGGGGSTPFSTPAAALRGNVVNTTSPANYILGYFSLSEIYSQSYVVH